MDEKRYINSQRKQQTITINIMAILTEDQIKKNSHISTKEIIDDISVTQKEIDQIQKEIDALCGDRVNNRMEIYMREGKVNMRKDLIESLNCILQYRENN